MNTFNNIEIFVEDFLEDLRIDEETELFKEEGKFFNFLSSDTKDTIPFHSLSFNSSKSLLEWMKSNIKYKKYSSSWRLMSPEEVYKEKRGNCFDQSAFEAYFLKKIDGLKVGLVFVIEFKEGMEKEGVGRSITHSLCYYIKNGKYYWFENAWGGNRGIFGPFESFDNLREAVYKKWTFHGNNDCLYVASQKSISPGVNLKEYCNEAMRSFSMRNVFKKKEEIKEIKEDAMLNFFNKYNKEALSLFTEATIAEKPTLRNKYYPRIEAVLSDPKKNKLYRKFISDFIERNTDKLTTPGPQYLIIFGDTDKEAYYELFGIDPEELKVDLKAIAQTAQPASEFKFLLNHSFLVVLYFCIRYFTITNDVKGVNSSIGIFAIDVYWSTFTKYFPKGVIEPFMLYTMDTLSNKFIIKKAGHVFGALVESALHSYDFHKENIKRGLDNNVVVFIQRIKNDQNSMFKTIADLYMKNYRAGNAISTRNDNYDPDNPILDDITTASTEVQMEVDKVVLPIITNGVDISLAEAASRMSNISITNLRMYLTKILVNERLEEIQNLVESIIFLYIYTDKKTIRDIRSQHFLFWAANMFKKTNSKDGNIVRMNAILDKWGTETGIYEAFSSEGSRINYKKAIFMYITMSIQKFT